MSSCCVVPLMHFSAPGTVLAFFHSTFSCASEIFRLWPEAGAPAVANANGLQTQRFTGALNRDFPQTEAAKAVCVSLRS